MTAEQDAARAQRARFAWRQDDRDAALDRDLRGVQRPRAAASSIPFARGLQP